MQDDQPKCGEHDVECRREVQRPGDVNVVARTGLRLLSSPAPSPRGQAPTPTRALVSRTSRPATERWGDTTNTTLPWRPVRSFGEQSQSNHLECNSSSSGASRPRRDLVGRIWSGL